MRYELDVREPAERDIIFAHTYYVSISKQAADGFLAKTESLFDQLLLFPESGSRRYKEVTKKVHIRYFRFADYPYLTVYCLVKNKVRILRCLHAHSDILATLTSPDQFYDTTLDG